MAPPSTNAPISGGSITSSKYRRRPNAATNSNGSDGTSDSFIVSTSRNSASAMGAVAAAEAAASSILMTDGGVNYSLGGAATNTTSVTSSSSSSSSNGFLRGRIGNDRNVSIGSIGTSLLFGLRQVLRSLQQQQQQQPYRRDRRASFSFFASIKIYQVMMAVIISFSVGIFIMGEGQQQKQQQQQQQQQHGGSRLRSGHTEKINVPLPHITKHNSKPLHHDLKMKSNSHSMKEKHISPSLPKEDNQSTINADQSNANRNHPHAHAIPPILIFTYHTNLLTTPTSQLADAEEIQLAKNIRQIISLHPHSTTRFLTDDDCLASIRNSLGNDTKLTEHFANESHGMYKADICRGAALYETGGLYFDIDIEARMPLWNAIHPTTEFVTTLVHRDSNHLGNFFQAFIGVTGGNWAMKRYLELFVDYYEGRVKVNGPLGVYFLRMAYDEWMAVLGDGMMEMKKEKKKKKEIKGGTAIVTSDTVDIWQEIKYDEILFPEVKKPPGKRRACKMLVVAPERTFGSSSASGGVVRKRMVPFYSHATGSRMCGGHDTK